MQSTNRVARSSMSASKQLVGLLRRMAAVLVEREEIRTRSRMVAYQNIGSMIGASSWWVRSLINGYDDERRDISFGPAVNLLALYDQLCERIEVDNHEQALRIAELQRAIYATAPRALAEVAANARGEPAVADSAGTVSRSAETEEIGEE